ncbi:hypothetical protein PV433_32135, partial [Paenibacillus sp. GYB004]|uniref:hypothetical protein n=1 Tax=Paenibacillus sp. GYB004 TaxID=2994393 RepID=UPI002F965F9F
PVEPWDGEPPRKKWSIRAVEKNTWRKAPNVSSVPVCPKSEKRCLMSLLPNNNHYFKAEESCE